METSFKTPVYIIKPKFSESLLNELEADIYKIQSNSPSIEVSNINGWHSETDLFTRKENSIKTLCGVLMTETTRQLMSISSNFDPKKYDGQFGGWININPKGGANATHHHQPWDWSGVFYVKQPNISISSSKINEDKRSGMIEFINPCQQSSGIAKKGFMNAGMAPFLRFRPNPGEIVLFPSYLLHSVYPNETDGDRITIAYNVRLNEK